MTDFQTMSICLCTAEYDFSPVQNLKPPYSSCPKASTDSFHRTPLAARISIYTYIQSVADSRSTVQQSPPERHFSVNRYTSKICVREYRYTGTASDQSFSPVLPMCVCARYILYIIEYTVNWAAIQHTCMHTHMRADGASQTIRNSRLPASKNIWTECSA